jgi:hypothetical protein
MIKMIPLMVIAMLGGQVLSFADDGAASGAVAIQEPEIGGGNGELSADSGDETDAQHAEPAEQVAEVGLGETNAVQGNSEPSRPADGDPA